MLQYFQAKIFANTLFIKLGAIYYANQYIKEMWEEWQIHSIFQ